MTDGMVLRPSDGRRIEGSGMIVKIGAEKSQHWSVFETQVMPGFDVGAHLHQGAEELFYIVEGELDLLAFEPQKRTPDNWRGWKSRDGAGVVRAGPGCIMFVPTKCPHAFFNPGTTPVRMIFLVSPPGHERYQQRMGELISRGGPPDAQAVAKLRAEFDIEQLTPLIPGRAPG